MNSPIKWVGGKRNDIKYFEQFIPKFEIYVEPFVGGGALYWYLEPKNAVINDVNSELINFYKELKTNYKIIIEYLNTYENTKEFYDDIVNKLNNKLYSNPTERAAIFYYINKTTFGGKWRVNKKGEFNSSYGYYKNELFKYIDSKCSSILRNTEIYNQDFKEILEKYKNNKNAFIFLDPPYIDCDSFYVEHQDFNNIYKDIYNAFSSNAKMMLIVKDSDYIRELFGDYIVGEYVKKYKYNAKTSKKNNHLIILNYKL